MFPILKICYLTRGTLETKKKEIKQFTSAGYGGAHLQSCTWLWQEDPHKF